jgi:sugar/nucleoside kinase (ribokinase family)
MHNIDVAVCGTFVADIIGRPINLKSNINLGSLSMIDEIKLFTGGLGCNLSIDLAKLNNNVGVIGRIGNDNWKDLFFSTFNKMGIDYSNVKLDNENHSAATIVCVDQSGERTFFHVGGAHMSVNANDILDRIDFIKKSKFFALGYYGCMPALEPDLPYVLREIKTKTETKVLLETAGFVKPTLDDLSRSLPFLDFLLPSYEEGKILTGEQEIDKILKRFREAGAGKIVGLKLGANGCFLSDPEKSLKIKSFKVNEVVDTTGAGDSFLAGIITGFLKGMDLYEMGQFANMVGACAVQALGASSGIKSFDETCMMIKNYNKQKGLDLS